MDVDFAISGPLVQPRLPKLSNMLGTSLHRLKGGGFKVRLKAGSVRLSADSGHMKVVIWLGGSLRFDVLCTDFISHVAAARNPIAPRPQVLAPIAFAQAGKLGQ